VGLPKNQQITEQQQVEATLFCLIHIA